jgi:hypothetical protein
MGMSGFLFSALLGSAGDVADSEGGEEEEGGEEHG